MDTGIGGQIQGISLDSFLQMVQMEGKTCTLTVKTADAVGYLYFLKGDLIDAEVGEVKHKEAAALIISWNDPVIEIEEDCQKKTNNINQSLMNILMEGMKLKDDRKLREKESVSPEKGVADKDAKEKDIISDLSMVEKAEEVEEVEDLLEKVKAKPEAPDVDTSLKDLTKPAEKIDEHEALPEIKIEDRQKKRIDQFEKPKKKRSPLILAAVAGAALIVIIALAFVISGTKSGRIKKEYKEIMVKVESQLEPQEKVKILQNFINAHKDNTYALNAEKKLKEINSVVETRDYQATLENADKLIAIKDYEKAAAVYKQHLIKHSDSKQKDEIKQKVAGISSLIDERDFKKVVDSNRLDILERVEIYLQYLANNPQGKHRSKVKKLISDIKEKYYLSIEERIIAYNKQEDWDKCIHLCNKFIHIYKDDKRSNELKGLIGSFRVKIKDKKAFAGLLKRAEQEGSNYKAASQIYIDYLKVHPYSTVKDRVEKELAGIEQQEQEERIQKTRIKVVALLQKLKGRFVANGDGTITDKRTGLMWCTLDSQSELAKCLNYESAAQYVQGLKTGGYEDWRLPTVKELAGIYKMKPFFPSLQERRYWTSKSYKRHENFWVTNVLVVSSKKETVWNEEQKDSNQCGAVHAVRK
ncbi:MAG: DUF1566 domain-containing protein [Thermodesulfobacteriota bacterium]|nr:DUF1566 domain-containing protein [Thermodesulfobacteriota bacterium]